MTNAKITLLFQKEKRPGIFAQIVAEKICILETADTVFLVS